MTAPSVTAQSAETKIVSWNLGAAAIERILERADDFRSLDREMSPDVIMLVELSGLEDLKAIASALDWRTFYAAVSDMTLQQAEIHFALEVGVISRIPVTAVVEHDAGPDRHVHPVFTNAHPNGDQAIPVTEVQLKGALNIGVGRTDRGTLQVDLANGLSLFPVHLKSNSNDVCFAVSDGKKALSTAGVALPPELDQIFENGSTLEAEADAENAQKRERVIAAVKLVADGLVADGRKVIIARDYNTSFEPGKVGSTLADCALQPFSCGKAPFSQLCLHWRRRLRRHLRHANCSARGQCRLDRSDIGTRFNV